MEQLLLQIGETYCRCIPGDWSEFQLIALIDGAEDDVFMESYKRSGEDVYRLFFDDPDYLMTDQRQTVIREARNAVLKLRDACFQNGNLWVKMIYTMTRDGQVRYQFKYSRMEP